MQSQTWACEYCPDVFQDASTRDTHERTRCSGARARCVDLGISLGPYYKGQGSVSAPPPRATADVPEEREVSQHAPLQSHSSAEHEDEHGAAGNEAGSPVSSGGSGARQGNSDDTEDGLDPRADDSATGPQFDTQYAIFRLVMGANNGAGMSTKDTAFLMRILNSHGFRVSALRHWRSKRAIERYGMRLLLGTRTYHKSHVSVPGWPTLFTVQHTGVLEALAELWRHPANAPGFALQPDDDGEDGGSSTHKYSGPKSGSLWRLAQKLLKNGEIVCPIILASDVTTLSGHQRTRVWPVYLTCANIQYSLRWRETGRVLLGLLPMPHEKMTPVQKVILFQKAMHVLLHDLFPASQWGTPLTDPQGVVHTVYPILYAYVGDYPEICKVSCTLQLGSDMPCSVCYVGKNYLWVIRDGLNAPRTVEQQMRLLNDPEEAAKYSTHPVESFLWSFHRPSSKLGNTYQALMPDLLHILYGGVLPRLVHVAKGGDANALVLDDRLLAAYDAAILAGVPLPSGLYFSRNAYYSAAEHAAMLTVLPFLLEGRVEPVQLTAVVYFADWHHNHIRAESYTEESLRQMELDTAELVRLLMTQFPRGGHGWNLIKVHGFNHLPEAIRRGGHPREYSTAPYENAHIRNCKAPYRTSNKRDYEAAILSGSTTRHAMAVLPPASVEGPREYNTAAKRARLSRSNTLTSTSALLTDGTGTHTRGDALLAQYNAASEGCLSRYPQVMQQHGYSSATAQAHRAVALPARDVRTGEQSACYARAAVRHHGSPAFSSVEYRGGDSELRYGKLVLLLRAKKLGADLGDAEREVAYIKPWKRVGVDGPTCCVQLQEMSRPEAHDVVPITSIVRTVHVVRSFERPRIWLLNKWADGLRKGGV
ncbi:hypothetical protein CLOM_g13678 [Closterium sp. NIES-68]|nr:hypothetical protein CLOM_g13678 [Closterium sp. NIES-68]